MATRIALTHSTTYRYSRPVMLGPQTVRLRPAAHCRTPIESYGLDIAPREQFLNWLQDPYGNHLARAVFPKPTRELRVDVRVVAELATINPFDFFLEPEAERIPFAYGRDLARELRPYLARRRPGPRLTALLERAPAPGMRSVDYLVALNRLVHGAVSYVVRMDPGVQTPEETLALGRGSCRDSAWLLVHLARRLGLAARFASGYLVQLAVDPDAAGKRDGPTADFVDLHAWCEIFLPGAGWIGLDPTSGLLAGEGHIPLACAAMPSSAAPISGGFAPCDDEEVASEMSVTMAVTRLDSTPRPAAPYSDERWLEILAAGDRVDAALAPARLTMGGEPTFVSVADRDAPEWTTAATGGAKRDLAERLVKRLRARFAPGGLLHYGQGKWYPGEPLPRWALGCYWRADGLPVWRDDALIADRARPPSESPVDARGAERFARALAAAVHVDPAWVQPAYEDAWYYLWREHRMPTDEDPYGARLDDALERERIARVFTTGLAAPVGYALPLAPLATGGWQSGPWTVRAGRLLLLPGDSPMGYRLPLDSLPWATRADRDAAAVERDPFAPRRDLGPRLVPARDARPFAAPTPVRTTLCVEPRDGVMHVFLPPTGTLEAFLELVGAIEDCAARLGQPVAIEGYHPPRDHRLRQLAVTPDPGVIEVNIHPQADWRSAVATTETLYAEAAECGLVAERFLVDGRACGTGGGNHVTLGGATPADSPFLRRPGLLRSVISYWHNHPSLSYLFSGLFVGPTSQAPRADEARTETVYELETALAQLPEHGPCPPWLVDRALRHLLIDLTGNTHRAEICIDKLFSPDSAAGRLGLVELRGFEMPSHPRLACAHQLLVRALVARFWHEPYRVPLARWGTDLHDRFMLPAVLWEDFRGVARELRERELPIEDEWYAPQRDFRFPPIGAIAHRGVRLELRQALEPWHVLGEEPGGGGTVRYVDSSVERLEVALTGLADDRHAVTCNGVPLPLHELDGRRVCGVRFRAWHAPSALHPSVPVHAPLVFDLVDTWNGRSLAGCTYSVAHPGGLSHERSPINAIEAESRRAARFHDRGHSPGRREVPQRPPDPEHPFTLDLRRAIPDRAALAAAAHGS